MDFAKHVLPYLHANSVALLAAALVGAVVGVVVKDILFGAMKALAMTLFGRARKGLPKGGFYVGRLSIGDVMAFQEDCSVERLHPRHREEIAQAMKAFSEMPKFSLNLPGYTAFNRAHGTRPPGD